MISLLGAQVKIRSDLIKVNSVILVLILPSLSDLWAPVWNRGVWVCTQPRSDSCGTEGILPPDISKNLGMTLMTDSCRHVSFLKQLFVCHKQQRSLCLSVSWTSWGTNHDCSPTGVRVIYNFHWSPPCLQLEESIKLSWSLKEVEKLWEMKNKQAFDHVWCFPFLLISVFRSFVNMGHSSVSATGGS